MDEGVGEEFVAFEIELFDHPALNGDVVVLNAFHNLMILFV